jgi:uncharacterized membrane protein
MNKLSPLIEIVLGAAMIFIGIDIAGYFGEYELPVRILGLAGIVLVMWGAFKIFIALIVYTIYVYARFIMRQDDDEPAMEKKGKMQEHILYGLMVGSLYFMTFEINNIDNTLQGTDLLVKSSAAGLIFAVLSLIVIYLLAPEVRKINLGFALYVAVPFSMAFLFPAAASIFNRTFHSKDTTENFLVLKKGNSSSTVKQYFIFIDNDGEKERLVVNKTLWENIEAKQLIQIRLRLGYLGYKYVYNIIPPADHT